MDPSPFVQHFEAPRSVFWNVGPELALLPAVTVVLWCSRRAKGR